MTYEEMMEHCVIKEGHIFQPLFLEVYNEETQCWEYTITKTAEEVYSQWLLNMTTNKSTTDSQRISDLEIKLMKLERGL